jgi:hypothetical protein
MWPTPNSERVSQRTDVTLSGDGRQKPNKLGWATAAFWSTPKASADKPGRPLAADRGDLQAQATLWATPTIKGDYNSASYEGKSGDGLRTQAVQWPTPNSEGGTGYMSGSNRDTWRPTLEGMALGYQPVLHQPRPSHPAPAICTHGPTCRPSLNPRFVSWLMNIPVGWVDAEHPLDSTSFERWAMLSSLLLQRLHFESSGDDSTRGAEHG